MDAGQADSVSERIATVLAAERTRDLWLAEQERVFGALPADPDADAHGKERLTAVPP
ncbi:hypothetical protein [Acrocarpospora sp. B8E8]|uniref:hypothetical protein n=1 Tax=Acrocarpospora sp. B8E8 TaxID=3153572 RepID=UPI00325F7996